VLYPVHYLIFEGMLRRISQAATASRETPAAGAPAQA
jgi:hypothetical protein